jgi:hypothetical protein
VSDEKENALVLPPFGKAPALHLEMAKIREAEARIHEAQSVNPLTYKDLEHEFNSAWRDLKRHLATLGYQLAMTEKALEEAKADVFLDKYPEYMAGKPKTSDNADMRKAFLSRDEAYSKALDRYNQLKAIEATFDGKAKSFEKICAYMKKAMDLVLRSGLSSSSLYNTQK